MQYRTRKLIRSTINGPFYEVDAWSPWTSFVSGFALPVHEPTVLEFREKPSFEPGYLRLKGVENAHAEWFFHAPIHADKYERVEVTPVVNESGDEV